MPKTIYTGEDIEALVKRGIKSLSVGDDDVVLTALAYEKAERLGLELIPGTARQSNPSAVVADARPWPKPLAEFARPASPQPASIPGPLRFSPEATEGELREAIVETGSLAYQKGLMVSNDGNISARMANGNILITPSGLCKGRLKAEDLLVVDALGNLVKPASDPALRTSSEQPMHLEVYRQRKDVRAVIHTHLVYANALAITVGKVRMDVIPEAAISFGAVPITDFAMPSTRQNADAIRHLIANHDVLLIRNHGSLTVGQNLEEALNNLERLEHVSKTLMFAELLGNINALPPDIIEAIAEISRPSPSAR